MQVIYTVCIYATCIYKYMYSDIGTLAGFHLGFSSRGGKHNNCRGSGGEGLYYILPVFLSVKNNIIVLINLFILGGSGNMLPQENF